VLKSFASLYNSVEITTPASNSCFSKIDGKAAELAQLKIDMQTLIRDIEAKT